MEVCVAPGGLIKGPMSLSEFSTMSRKAETWLLSLRTLLDKRLSIIDSSFCGEAEAETKSDPGPLSGCKPPQLSLMGLDTNLNTVLESKVVSNYWPFHKFVFQFFSAEIPEACNLHPGLLDSHFLWASNRFPSCAAQNPALREMSIKTVLEV